jgi:Phage portal protein, SPP1 Gp6-like
MKPTSVEELVKERLLPAFLRERERLDRIDLWYRWQHENIQLPRSATPELKRLVELSKTPWLGLVVTTVAQALYVNGYRSPDLPENSGPWRTWQANDFDNRQIAIHRAALAYGSSYVTVLPGDLDGRNTSVMRGVSPRKMLAVYADPAEDDWPLYAIRVEKSGDELAIRVLDEEKVHYLSTPGEGSKVTYIEGRTHGIGFPPVVRYANMLDLDGRTDGEVEPFIPVAARINKTAFDRLLTQHYSSWKVRTVAGMAEPDTEEEAIRAKLKLRQDDLLVAEDPDTKFGTLDETPLDGFIRAEESDVEKLAAVTQTPATALTGKVVNVAADALAQARAPLTQKVTERQKAMGKSHDQALRLAAALEGDEAAAGDVMAHVTWQDMDIRSLSQAVDALGKAATMLQIPPQALWGRIPGVTKSDVDEWKRIASTTDTFAAYQAFLEAQMGGADDVGATVGAVPQAG